MKSGWRTTQLGKLCSIKNGKSNAQDADKDGAFVFFDRSKTIKRSSHYLYDCEALIIPGEGAEFLPRHYAGKFDLHQRAYALFEFVPDINTRFLYYYLIHVKDYFPRVAVGATVKSLRLRHFEQLPVIFPCDLDEQRRIVGILDEAFAGIAAAVAHAEKNLKNARELFETDLNGVFSRKSDGWVEKKLGDVCGISSKLVDPRKPDFIDLPHVGAGNIVAKTGEIVDVKTARAEGLKSGKYLYDQSMILYSKIRPYLMKVCRPNCKGLCSADVYPLAPIKGELERDFLFYLLLSQRFTAFAIAGSDRAGMPKVNRDHLFRYLGWFPCIDEQKRIVIKLDSIAAETHRLTAFYERKLALLAELKQSLLAKAFAGELTARFPKAIQGITTTDLHAGVLAIAFQAHAARKRLSDFGHVKAEKIAHMVESFAGVDLGRSPVKDAAGPNDFPHLMKVEHRAAKAGYFTFRRVGTRYEMTSRRKLDTLIEKARKALGEHNAKIDYLLDLMVPMTTKQAEIFATVYAAWNNLLLQRVPITDEAIVFEAREKWHPDKLKIGRKKFFAAIEWLRKKGVVPIGRGKEVGPRT